MIFKITFRSSPKTFMPFVYFILLLALGFALLFFLNFYAGIILIAVSAFFGYGIYKLFLPVLKSSFETDQTSITYDTGYGERNTIMFKDITHAGIFVNNKNREILFIYNKKGKNFFTIPDNFSNFSGLKEIVGGFRKLDIHNIRPGEAPHEKMQEIYK